MHKERSLVLLGCLAFSLSLAQTSFAKEESQIQPYQPPEDAPAIQPAVRQGEQLYRAALVMTAVGQKYAPGYLIVRDGLIVEVGQGKGTANPNTEVVEVSSQIITPGIIDTHSHMGVYPWPGVQAHSDGNEATSPLSAEVWAEHSFWPLDPALITARAGGITTIQVLPGSANLIGGRSFTAKLRPANSARAMRFYGAPQGLKMACGENPKRVYGEHGGPQTRMGNVAGYRKAYQKALEYKRAQERYQRELANWNEKKVGVPPEPPSRDFASETLEKVLNGEILVHMHCYRADEMHQMLDIAKSYGFKIRSFHHAVEAYKLRERLAEEDVSVSTWSDWYGFKMEAYDGIPQNAAMLSAAGAKTIIHSDSATEIRHLNQEAAKARRAGEEVGITIDDNEVLRWITANPAWALGIDDKVGTLEKGKQADFVIWSANPFSVYALPTQTYIDGYLVFDRSKPMEQADFQLGQTSREGLE